MRVTLSRLRAAVWRASKSGCGAVGLFLLASVAPLHAGEFLHTRGVDIVDDQGQVVMLRGVGLGNWFLPEGYMWRFGERGDRPRKIEQLVTDLIGPEAADRFWIQFRRNYIAEADLKRIAELGFNSVRPSLNARRFLTEGENPVSVAEGFEVLDHLVQWCKKYGLYVILDMHAAPGGQTGANIDDSAHDQPELFQDPRNQDRLLDLWLRWVRRYKDEPTVAGYDLLNEPLPARTGAAAKYKDQLEPLYRRLTRAIRAVDSRHLIFVEGADWANDWSVFTTPFDANLVYQFHYYCWNRPDHLNDIDKYLADRRRLQHPVWVGETGEKDNTIYWATTDYFEANRIGWAFWPWKKMETVNTPYSIRQPEGWDAVRAYSRGGDKPGRDVAQKAFDQLLQNIKLENCVYFPDVVNALFHRVPGRVEAENYGHEGLDQSYFVKDTSFKAQYYRTSEPVPIELIGSDGNRWRSAQAIRLGAGEWTAYTLQSLTARDYAGRVKARSDRGAAEFTVSLNGDSQPASVSGSAWTEVRLGTLHFAAGSNRLKLQVHRGTVSFDWLSFQ